jgi:hypothetical protein
MYVSIIDTDAKAYAINSLDGTEITVPGREAIILVTLPNGIR